MFKHGTNYELEAGIIEQRERSEIRRIVRSRSALIVPMKEENHPEGSSGGKRGVGLKNCYWETRRIQWNPS